MQKLKLFQYWQLVTSVLLKYYKTQDICLYFNYEIKDILLFYTTVVFGD